MVSDVLLVGRSLSTDFDHRLFCLPDQNSERVLSLDKGKLILFLSIYFHLLYIQGSVFPQPLILYS
jgi:hypothetical protein